MFKNLTDSILRVFDFSRGDGRDASTINARKTAGRFSRGSIALQSDLFVTESDMEREREETKKYKFAS